MHMPKISGKTLPHINTLEKLEIPVVSLENLKSQYLLTIDLPTVPSVANEIIRSPKDLIVQGFDRYSEDLVVFFKLSSVNQKMRIFYRDGKLSMVLPKMA